MKLRYQPIAILVRKPYRNSDKTFSKTLLMYEQIGIQRGSIYGSITLLLVSLPFGFTLDQ